MIAKYVSIALFFFLPFTKAIAQYGIADIPNPKSYGQDYYVSNPDHIINRETTNSINRICQTIQQATGAEVAVVAINDFLGEDEFDFALQLFRTWGVGTKEKNNGLLLFVAKNRKAYRFITGYGLEGLLPDALLKYIGEHELVPYFKAENYNQGLYRSLLAIEKVLLSPDARKELLQQTKRESSFWFRYQTTFVNIFLVIGLFFFATKQLGRVSESILSLSSNGKKKKKRRRKPDYYPLIMGIAILLFLFFLSIFPLAFFHIASSTIFSWTLLPWYFAIIGVISLYIKYTDTRDKITYKYRDEGNLLAALSLYYRKLLFPLILSPLCWFSLYHFLKRRNIGKKRLSPPDKIGEWERKDRDQLKVARDFLDDGQLCEEKIRSQVYEIWINKQDHRMQLTAWPGTNHASYTACPTCGYHTFSLPVLITRISPTYKKEGLGEKIRQCSFCSYQESLGTLILPLKERNSSSSSSGDSSSGGGNSSSSGGSWGGGSSGGGGAGGHW